MLKALNQLRLLQRSGFTLATAEVRQDTQHLIIKPWKAEPSTKAIDQYLMTIGECMDFIPLFSSVQVVV